MSFVSNDPHISELYRFAMQKGFSEELFLSPTNLGRYVKTAVDGFREYPLFLYVFHDNYDEKTFTRMLKVDFKCRMGLSAGLSSGENYESVMILEPPEAKKTGMKQYLKAADFGAYSLLFKGSMHRLDRFEKYATEQRAPWQDDENTWYLYLFATGMDFQGQGHGKKLLNLMQSFADETRERICLETNLDANVSMYERFGYRVVKTDRYQDAFPHYVMLYAHGNA